MLNKYNKVDVTFDTGNEFVEEIQVLFFDTFSLNVFIIENYNKVDLTIDDNFNSTVGIPTQTSPDNPTGRWVDVHDGIAYVGGEFLYWNQAPLGSTTPDLYTASPRMVALNLSDGSINTGFTAEFDTSTAANVDIFELPSFDFSNTTNISVSFDYSFARKTGVVADTFKLQYSLDCGGSWSNILGIPAPVTMATNSGGTTTTPFVPTPAQWKQFIVNPSFISLVNNKPSVKFRFYFRSH
jgi:hypothetical protein